MSKFINEQKEAQLKSRVTKHMNNVFKNRAKQSKKFENQEAVEAARKNIFGEKA